jgi:hypothetical protein
VAATDDKVTCLTQAFPLTVERNYFHKRCGDHPAVELLISAFLNSLPGVKWET